MNFASILKELVPTEPPMIFITTKFDSTAIPDEILMLLAKRKKVNLVDQAINNLLTQIKSQHFQ